METDPKDKRPELTLGERQDLFGSSFGQLAREELEKSEKQEREEAEEPSN